MDDEKKAVKAAQMPGNASFGGDVEAEISEESRRKEKRDARTEEIGSESSYLRRA